MKEITLDIGEVVKQSGLPASTLRYYEERSLIKSVGRNGLRRLFDGKVIAQLSLISLGRLAGLSLDEIAAMFTADGRPQINREQLLSKADELEQQVTQLTAMRDGLRHVAQCPEPDHFQCPKFIKMLTSANNQVRSKSKT